MAHEVGYARVSKRDQNPEAQEAELRAAGCERVFVDHGESSRVTDRPQWLACLDYLRPGDALKVRRLDRLAGSERILIETLQDLDTTILAATTLVCALPGHAYCSRWVIWSKITHHRISAETRSRSAREVQPVVTIDLWRR